MARIKLTTDEILKLKAVALYVINKFEAIDILPLFKIIYFADMIEPARDYPAVEHLRELSKTVSIDEMVLAGLSQSIEFVLNKNHLIHPDTVVARNEILLKLKK